MLVLIVDDDKEDREMLSDAIAEVNPGIKCLQATNGSEALTMLTEDLVIIPNAVFLDINMPVMNGKEFLVNIQGTSDWSGVPIVMFTTSSSKDDAVECLKLGARAFITKPDSHKKLVGKVAELLPTLLY